MNLKQYVTVGAGILVSVCIFVPLVEITDPNDYNLSTDPVTGLARYKPNSSFMTAGIVTKIRWK